MDLRVGGKFKLIKRCGSGAFGEIYQGKLNQTLYSNRLYQLFSHYRPKRKDW